MLMQKRAARGVRHRIKHHAKKIYHKTPKFVHGMVVGAFVGIIGIMITHMVAPVSALSLSAPRDCDSNAVISCGALTVSELQQHYGAKSVVAIYNYFGITSKDIKAMNKTAVAGRVYKNGNVTIGKTTVATNAITAGRENIAGSKKVTSGGTTFYTRAPSVSFHPDSIAAFIVMEDGQFKFAILGPCSNPVTATAVAKKSTPPPAPEPTPEETAPPTTVGSSQTPESTTAAPAVAPAATVLPDTGPGDVVIIGLLAIIGGYLFHVTHRHIRRKRRV